MTKNQAAADMAKLRWANTTPEYRKEHARKMAAKSAKARRKKNKDRPFAKLK